MGACDRYIELLSARLDGMLTDEEERELEIHLSACPACRALESQLTAIHTAFTDLEEVPAPEGFAQGVMSRVQAEEGQKKKTVPLLRRPQVRALAGLAACAVLCVGVYQSGIFGGEKDAVTFERATFDDTRMSVSAAENTEDTAANSEFAQAFDGEEVADALPAETSVLDDNLKYVSSQFNLQSEMDTTDSAAGFQTEPKESVSQYEAAGWTVDAVLALTQLPEGAEEVLGPAVESSLDEEGRTCYLVTWEQVEALLALIQEQDSISSSMTTPWTYDGMCAVVLTGEE